MDKLASSLDSSVHFTTRIYQYLKSSSSLVTICATGPLTNIALLLINYPDVTKYIKLSNHSVRTVSIVGTRISL